MTEPKPKPARKPAAARSVTAAAKPRAAAAKPVRKPAATKSVTAAEDIAATTEEAASPAAQPSSATPTRVRAVAKARKAAADADRSALDVARRIVELAEDKKAADIVLLDLGGLTTLADYFVVCSGGSERQLDAIANGIVGGMRDEKIRPFGREGTPASHWVLVDFGIVIVHIFTPPERDFYQLEKHWSEAKTILRVQ
ncbi:MAG: ribosome silencing factor [Chloroflexota bacterium]